MMPPRVGNDSSNSSAAAPAAPAAAAAAATIGLQGKGFGEVLLKESKLRAPVRGPAVVEALGEARREASLATSFLQSWSLSPCVLGGIIACPSTLEPHTIVFVANGPRVMRP